MVIPVLPSLVSKNIISKFTGFDYTDVITEKVDFKQQLLSVGVGFDGAINYPICFKAFFDTTEVQGSVKIAYDSIYDQFVDVTSEFSTLPGNGELLYIGTKWNVNLTDPAKLSASTTEFNQYCSIEIYDPLLACANNTIPPNSLCGLISMSPNGREVGWYGQIDPALIGTTQQVAPALKDYYFATSYNTWATANIRDSANNEVSCAKFVPVDCLTDEITPIKPLLEEKLLAISDKSSEKNDFLSLLTLGAFDEFLNDVSGAQSTDDLTASLLEKLTGTDMLSFNKVLDPVMIEPLDFTNLQTLIESKNANKTGELNMLKSIIDPLGVLSLLGKFSMTD